MSEPRVGIVVIGRNEGERLSACLASLPKDVPTVYVDSASSDDSVARAQRSGVSIVAIRPGEPLGAGRARNRGFQALSGRECQFDFVQMIDGDCALDAGWLAAGARALTADPKLAAVCGRLRERYPTRNVYGALCDDEWNMPVGPIEACGGIAMFRADAFREAQGFNVQLMAGEEPDLCLRLGAIGWRIARIDADMAVHDADMTRFPQWWRRAKRGGFAYAEHLALHGKDGLASWRKQVVSTVAWALVVPLVLIALIAMLPGYWRATGVFAGCGLFGAQVLRVALRKYRSGSAMQFALAYGIFMMFAKFAQFAGILAYVKRRITRQAPAPIEHRV